MKVAAPYPFKKDRQKLINEYNVEFDCSKHYIKDLTEWLDKQLKRINIRISFSEKDARVNPLDVIKAIADYDKVYFRLGVMQGKWLKTIQDNNVKFFFDYDYNINSFCRLYDALEQGSSDVYIMEDLCYRLPQVRNLCNKYGAQIRFVANLIPSYTTTRSTDPTSSWYTPENYNKLNVYYDVIEFELFNSWQRFDALYKIWVRDKEWRDNLKFINFELGIDIPGESFPNELCEYRMTCGHRCVERQSKCRKCQQYIELAQIMADKNIEYTSEKIWVQNDNDEPIKSILE